MASSTKSQSKPLFLSNSKAIYWLDEPFLSRYG